MFYTVQWKHWSQIRSTIYISSKVGQSGCGNTKKKKVFGGLGGGEEGGTPVLHSGIFLQCVEFIENSLIPRYLTASGRKKTTKSNISNQSRKIH